MYAPQVLPQLALLWPALLAGCAAQSVDMADVYGRTSGKGIHLNLYDFQ